METFSHTNRRLTRALASGQTSKRCLCATSSASTPSRAKFLTCSSSKLNAKLLQKWKALSLRTLRSILKTCKNLKVGLPRRSSWRDAKTCDPLDQLCNSMVETWRKETTQGAWLAHQINKLGQSNVHKCRETRLRMLAAWISSFSYLRSIAMLPSAKVPIPRWTTPVQAFAPSLTTATVDLKSSQASTSHLMHMERMVT